MAAFIAAQRDRHGVPVAVACRALRMSPAWFYKWRDGDVSLRRARRRALADLVATLFARHRGRYGSPRIAAELRELGWRVSQNTVAHLMAEQHLRARPKRRRTNTTRPGRGRWRAPDQVKRDFSAERINQRWFGDGTEIVTDQGKLYLASVLDIYSRRIVGFALSEHHDSALAYAALAMAVAIRGGTVDGVVLHTDGGSEYTARTFQDACTRLGITQSMGRPGSALDHAAIESCQSAALHLDLRTARPGALRDQGCRPGAGWRPGSMSTTATASTPPWGCAPRSPSSSTSSGSPFPPRPACRRPRRRQGQALRVAYGQP